MILSEKKHWKWFAALTVVILALTAYIGRSIFAEPGIFWHRFELVLIVYIFLAMHCFLNIKEMYNRIYKYRVLIAIGLFVFAVANCFTYSSVSMYNLYIQPNSLSQYSEPIFGTAKAIRSDEWLVSISRIIAGSFNHYGATNDIVRGTLTSGISATSGLYLDYSALRSPSTWGYYLFGAEYGNSFAWNFQMIFGALFTFEFFNILTKGKRLYSFFGTVLVWFSSFNLWWSLCIQMLGAMAIVVFFYYMVIAENWKRRLLFGTLLAFAGANFCTNLYPAWQVPFGWVILALMVWILIENQEWKKYKVLDWLMIAVDVLFMISIIFRFIQVDAEYMHAVTATVYPGRRISYGGFVLDKLLGYAPSAVMPIIEIGSAPETGTFFGTFPLGLITAVYVLKKENWKNTLIWCLLAPMTLFTIYCTVGMPPMIAKLFLLTNSTPIRTVDALGALSAILFIVSMGEMDSYGRVNKVWSALIAAVCTAVAVLACYGTYSMKAMMGITIIEIITAIGIYLFINNGKEILRKGAIIATSVILLADAALINPITVGFSAITKKPLYSEVRSILNNTNEHTLWLGVDNIVNPCYLIACGAPTLNSTNYVPNKELWKILDPEDKYEEVWNRYAHLNMVLSNRAESKITLEQADVITVELSKKDFLSLGIDYILSSSVISSSYQDILENIYNEDGSLIYKVKK